MVWVGPSKDRDIDKRVLFKMSLVFGSVTGLFPFYYFVWRQRVAITVTNPVIHILVGWVGFFIGYKSTFALFWNRRARRLRNGPTK